MYPSLPAVPAHARSLTGLVPELLRSLDGGGEWLAPARSAVIAVIDGLGAQNLSERAGHARFLSSHMARKDVAATVFPSTTAAALASLLTGTEPGVHGLVGYRAYAPELDRVVSQLRGFEQDGLDPLTWQRATPLFSTVRPGRRAVVVSRPEYERSGLTQALMRGAEFASAHAVSERVRLAADAASTPGTLVYLYIPELDVAGHRYGCASDQWIAALEEVDDALRALDAEVAPDTGILVTADHGMIDVPRHRQLLFGVTDALADRVRLVGGEPRMLHLYCEPGQADAVAESWRAEEGHRSWVLTRGEAVAAGLFGDVDGAVAHRIGDVLVAARGGVAYYDEREPDTSPQKMVGQHGSLTLAERIVPLIRLSAFA